MPIDSCCFLQLKPTERLRALDLLSNAGPVPPRRLRVLDDDVAEEEAARLTDGTQAALEAGAEELLSAAAVDHEDAQTGRDVPDVREGDHGELPAPAQRQRAAAQDAEDVVAASLGAVEAGVGAPPAAVDGVSAVGLGNHVREFDLKVIECRAHG